MPLPRSPRWLPLLGLLLLAPAAGAELYRVEGELREVGSGRIAPLLGLVEIEPADGDGPGLVSRFALAAGDTRLLRQQPFGRGPAGLERGVLTGDRLAHDGARIESLRLTTELLRTPGSGERYRRWQLEAQAGQVERIDATSGLPERFEARGELRRSSYASKRCLGLPDPGLSVPADATLTLAGGDLPLRAGASPSPSGPGGAVLLRAEPTPVDLLLLPGAASGNGDAIELAPNRAAVDARLEIVAHPAPPAFGVTLSELGIEAPAGTRISVDADGVVRVETPDSLYIDAGRIEIEGLTGLELRAGGSIGVGPRGIELPEGVVLRLEAGDRVEIEGGELSAPPRGDLELSAEVDLPGSCSTGALRPDGEDLLGSFGLRAERVAPVHIEVKRKRLRLHRRGPVPVVVKGSQELDVRDLDPTSLRLGRQGAPVSRGHRLRKAPRRRDVDRDGHLDLLLHFRLEHTGIMAGDTSTCLTGRTRDGRPILGCGSIDTGPTRAHRTRSGRPSR